MEKEIAFQILKVPETKDESAIQTAYRTQLRTTNPEDNPEGFKRLRQAYELALELARLPEPEPERERSIPQTETDLWFQCFDELYQDITARHRLDLWEQLLEDPICMALDTSMEVRDRLMPFLMTHLNLARPVWEKIDEIFEYTADEKLLREQSPEGFYHYLPILLHQDPFIPFELFEYTGLDQEESNGEKYLKALYQLICDLDDLLGDGVNRLTELSEGKLKDFLERVEQLSAFGVYHPYEDVQRLRLYTVLRRFETARELADQVGEKLQGCAVPENARHYMDQFVGELHWEMGEIQRAHDIWQGILTEAPDFYNVKLDMVCYYMRVEDYFAAKELLNSLFDSGEVHSEKASQLLQEVNERLISFYKGKLAGEEAEEAFSKDKLLLELARCLYQNERFEEGICLLEDFCSDQKEEGLAYDYYNIFGNLLYQNREYGRAVFYLERWKDMIHAEENASEEAQRRRSHQNEVCMMLAVCYSDTGRQELADAMLQEALEAAGNQEEYLEVLHQKASLLLEGEFYEAAVDVCDQLLQRDPYHYAAYLIRQEAFCKLHRGKEVIDDFYHAIEIYSGYYKPYLFAAKAFLYYNQFQEGMEVLKLAERNEVSFSPEMKLCKASLLHKLADSNGTQEEILSLLHEVEEAVREGNHDLEDVSEVSYGRALLCWAQEDFSQMFRYMEEAIRQNPARLLYRAVRGNMYLDRGQYMQALEDYEKAGEEYENNPAVLYGKGVCYQEMGLEHRAVEYLERTLEGCDTYRDACVRLCDYYRDKYHATYQRVYLERAITYITRQLMAEENSFYLVHRGLIYMNSAELEKAIADFRKALEHQEDDWAAWNNLGCCYKYLGDPEQAISYLEQAEQLRGSCRTVLPYCNLADCYEMQGDYHGAIQCYRRALSIDGSLGELWEEIGDLHAYQGEYEEAVEAYQRAGSAEYERKVGDVWIKKGNRRKGLRCYRKWVRAARDSEQAKRLILFGQLYADALEEYKRAVRCFEKALTCTDDRRKRFDAQRLMAKAYYFMGNREAAREHALAAQKYFELSGQGKEEEFLAYGPCGPLHLGQIGWLYACLGDEQRARECFAGMEKRERCLFCRYPKCFESSLYLGDLCRMHGEMAEAEREYRETLHRNPHCGEASLGLGEIETNNQ